MSSREKRKLLRETTRRSMDPIDSIHPRKVAGTSPPASSFSVATQKAGPCGSRPMLGPVAREFIVETRPLVRLEAGLISVSSASCNSSASRTTGQDSRPRPPRSPPDPAPLPSAASAGSVRAQLHGSRPALFERSIVQIRVGIGVQDLVRERRRLRRVDRDGSDAPVVDTSKTSLQARRDPSPRADSWRSSRSPADDRESESRPTRFSAQAAWSGNTAASKSSERMR